MGTRVHVVAGQGEVGSSLAKVLEAGEGNRVLRVDPAKGFHYRGLHKDADYLHVCIPFSDRFLEDVNEYALHFCADVVVVHSTVPVGTTKKLICREAVHSPIEGLHPNLERSIRTFPKHFGGSKAARAAEPFRELGITVRLHNQPETTELAKILSTSAYGIGLLLAQEQAQLCRRYGVSYSEAVQGYTRDYNASYAILDHPEVLRPILTPPQGKIGGHCVVQNAQLIQDPPTMHKMLARFNDD